MKYAACELWRQPPDDLLARLDATLDAALAGREDIDVFFRADDIAQPGREFTAMLEVFRRHEAPLALAVVPTWLPPRAVDLRAALEPQRKLWNLHQHGYRHLNHEPAGVKKQEFGPARDAAAKERDILRGLALIERHLAGFAPLRLFTPPWNRCDVQTMEALVRAGFLGLSRSTGAKPPAPAGLPDLPVAVDLHIRKEDGPQAQLDGLLRELATALASGRCGVMLHHQRQSPVALAFLDRLLGRLTTRASVRVQSMENLLHSAKRR